MTTIFMLMRHSLPKHLFNNDSGLGETGIEVAQDAAMEAAAAGYIPDEILYSRLPRARETALCIRDVFEKAAGRTIKLTEIDDLHEDRYNARASAVFNHVSKDSRTVLVVSHKPNIGSLGMQLSLRDYNPGYAEINVLQSEANDWSAINRMKYAATFG